MRNSAPPRHVLENLLAPAARPARATEDGGAVFLTSLRALCGILRQSPLGLGLLRHAAAAGVAAGQDPLLEAGSSYFYPAHNRFDLGWQTALAQRTERGMCRYLSAFTGALRRVWQHGGGMGAEALHPRDFLRFHRCAEADAQAVIHHVAWELRTAGIMFFWRHLAAGEGRDIAAAYQRIVEEDPEAPYNGAALLAAFDQWFSDEARIAAADRAALEQSDMALLGGAFRRGFARMDMAEVCALGLLPGGKNYLSGCFLSNPRHATPPDAQARAWLAHIGQDIAAVQAGVTQSS